jgi:hypothetical protein
MSVSSVHFENGLSDALAELAASARQNWSVGHGMKGQDPIIQAG